MLLRLQRQLPELRLEGLALSYQDGLSHGKGEYVSKMGSQNLYHLACFPSPACSAE